MQGTASKTYVSPISFEAICDTDHMHGECHEAAIFTSISQQLMALEPGCRQFGWAKKFCYHCYGFNRPAVSYSKNECVTSPYLGV